MYHLQYCYNEWLAPKVEVDAVGAVGTNKVALDCTIEGSFI